MRPERFLQQQYPAGTFHAVLQAFIRRKQAELSPPSVLHLTRYLWPLGEFLGNPQVGKITRHDLKRFEDRLWLRYSAGTIRPWVGDIKQFFRWAKKRKYIAKNPAKSMTKPRVRATKNKAVPDTAVSQVVNYLVKKLEPLVYRDVFGVLHRNPHATWGYEEVLTLRDLTLLMFLYETGCRAGELCRLSSRAMNASCDEMGANGLPIATVISTGKTGDKAMHFTINTAELWPLWGQVRPPGCDEYAFVSWKRGQPPQPMRTNGIAQMLVRRCKQARARPFRPHSLRHAKVARGRQAVGVELTSRLLEHSSIAVTLGYANIRDDELYEAALATGWKHRLWA